MIRETAGQQRRLLLASLVTLVVLAGLGVGWFFPPINRFGGFSPWELLTGETPSAKVNAFIDAVSRGDEAAALALWELPKTPFPAGRTQALGARRLAVTRDLILAGVRPRSRFSPSSGGEPAASPALSPTCPGPEGDISRSSSSIAAEPR